LIKPRYFFEKLAGSIITLFFVLTFNFYLFRILPGNPFTLLFRGPAFTPEMVNELNKQFGLDQPVWVQYLIYLRNTAMGNLGISYQTRAPVLDVIIPSLINTLLLLAVASAISIVLGIVIGMVAAWKRGTDIDIVASATTLILYCMPTFWLGLILMYLGVIYLGLPVSGMTSFKSSSGGIFAQVQDLARHMILPLLTLVLGLIGQYVLVMKGALLDVFTEDFMLAARAKGISERRLLWNHGFRNAMLPIITLIALNLGLSFGGAVQTESVFSWPGIGLVIYRAILARDYPVLQGCFLIIALAVVFANFIADMLYPLIDPRVETL
jgi:peptide/nickel transport system permease protein